MFDWSTDPALPGLSTRTGGFTVLRGDLGRRRSGTGDLEVAGRLLRRLDVRRAAATAGARAAGRILRGGLARRVVVRRVGIRVDRVRLAHGAVVARGSAPRTSMFVFLGSTCVAEEAAPAELRVPCRLVGGLDTRARGADGCRREQHRSTDRVRRGAGATAQPHELDRPASGHSTALSCSVFVESASEPTVLAWLTAPFEPGLSTRTGMSGCSLRPGRRSRAPSSPARWAKLVGRLDAAVRLGSDPHPRGGVRVRSHRCPTTRSWSARPLPSLPGLSREPRCSCCSVRSASPPSLGRLLRTAGALADGLHPWGCRDSLSCACSRVAAPTPRARTQ